MAKAASKTTQHDQVIDAFMALAAEKRPDAIRLEELATAAGVTMAELRGLFGSWFDVLAAFAKRIDKQVLEGIDADLAGESTKERLFDLIMRRLDTLAPYKMAIRHILRAAGNDPGLLMGLNRLSRRSQQWMLAAAGAQTSGPAGLVKAQALAVLYARVVRVWLDDEDEAQARTMAALDKELQRAEQGARLLDRLDSLASPLRAVLCRGSRRAASWRQDRWGDRGGQREEVPGSWRGDDPRTPGQSVA